tara:strand:- start:494 stop:1273 length:780 start_codon:yes stop_codon:yes gene_type:complete
MKALSQILFQIVIISSFSISVMASGENQEAVVVVEHWPPWQVAYDEKKKKVTGGLSVEIVQELFKRLNIKMTLRDVPWKRALAQIEEGKADVVLNLAKTSEREAYMNFTIPVYKEPILFVYSTDRFKSFKWEQWEDLKPYKIGVTRGYAYGDLNEKITEYNLPTHQVTADKQLVSMLSAGRIDIAPLLYVNGVTMINELPAHEKLKLRFAKKPIAENTYHFGISKKAFFAARISDVNQTIQEMKDDGTFKKILGKYYVE